MTNDPRPSERSPDAFRLYRSLVEDSNREGVVVHQDFDLTEAESTWYELTACEVEVFGLDPRLGNALMWAAVRYEDMIGMTDREFFPWREAERRAYPEFYRGECVFLSEVAAGFMATACGLPYAQALLWVCRAQVQLVRSGLIDAGHPAPHWALAQIAA